MPKPTRSTAETPKEAGIEILRPPPEIGGRVGEATNGWGGGGRGQKPGRNRRKTILEKRRSQRTAPSPIAPYNTLSGGRGPGQSGTIILDGYPSPFDEATVGPTAPTAPDNTRSGTTGLDNKKKKFRHVVAILKTFAEGRAGNALRMIVGLFLRRT
ncbi:hypothetical protein R3P38DRAFT_2794633 [Favolaschia claudopus]|uniref:Uncharacterized protein n=1 Tax=Favolaschia claudopus TaxID=2862362 RepID=A0AAW0AA34_9AGAR